MTDEVQIPEGALESESKVCEFCGKSARCRRPYVQPTSPHTQTYWLTLCEDCDKHQLETDQRLMTRLGYRITLDPATITSRRGRGPRFYIT